MDYGFEQGEAVPTCGPDIYFDEQDDQPLDPMEMAREVLKLIVGSTKQRLQISILCCLLEIGFDVCSKKKIARQNNVPLSVVNSKMETARALLGLQRGGTMLQMLEHFRTARDVVKIITTSKNPKLQAEILCLLMGIGFRGCSEQEIASRNGLTRAAISARMVKTREVLGLQRPVGPMRLDTTRAKCVASQILSRMN